MLKSTAIDLSSFYNRFIRKGNNLYENSAYSCKAVVAELIPDKLRHLFYVLDSFRATIQLLKQTHFELFSTLSASDLGYNSKLKREFPFRLVATKVTFKSSF
jgi:hypothetical protein